MSLDNASHPGGSGLDELVPSRYAVRVGEIDVLVISDGVLPIAGKTIAYNADSADLASWLDDHVQRPLEHVRRQEHVVQPGRQVGRVGVGGQRHG